jgi:putative addiction module component (TIGR02574 family)
MTPTLQDLKDASSGLPAAERAELAHFLLRSLEPEKGGWVEAWREELGRRLQEIRAGQVVGVPAEEVLRLLAGGRAPLPEPPTGAALLAYWQAEGLVGPRPEIASGPAHARALREQAQRRARP